MVATRTLDDLLGRSLFNGVRGTVILRTKIFKSISIQVDLAFFLSRYWGGGLNNAIVYIYIYINTHCKNVENLETHPTGTWRYRWFFLLWEKIWRQVPVTPPPLLLSHASTIRKARWTFLGFCWVVQHINSCILSHIIQLAHIS